MNYRYFIWLLPFLTITTLVSAVELEEECINDPIFKGVVCVYQANRDYTNSIFLIHGIGDNGSHDWDGQLSELAKHYRIITFDLPGFGRSEKGDKHYSPEKYAALIDFIAGYYAIHYFDLVGHSMGAAVSILYASKFPKKVRRLVVVDVAGILHRLAIGKFVIAEAINSDVVTTNIIETYVVKIIEKFERLFSYSKDEISKRDEPVGVGIELVNYNFSEALDKLDTPTLIVWGENDHIAPLRTAKVLSHRIRNSQIKIINGTGHMSMKDRAEEFNSLLMDYLQEVEVNNDAVNEYADASLKRHGICKQDRGVKFSGDYSRIEISNCSEVNIENARIDELYVFESRVVIDDSRIGGDVPIAIKSIGSDIKITTSKIAGDIAIEADRSRLDMAAVDIHINENAVLAISKSRVVFSICKIHDGLGVYNIHNNVTLNSGDLF